MSPFQGPSFFDSSTSFPMSVIDFFAGEIGTELMKQLSMISAKEWRYKNTAKQLLTSIKKIQPTIREIQYSGVELPAHRQAQIGMLFDALEKGQKLTDQILTSPRWDMCPHLSLVRKFEKLEMTISDFLKAEIHTQILADVHRLKADAFVGLDRMDKTVDRIYEQIRSPTCMEQIEGGGFIIDVMNLRKIRNQLGMIIAYLLLLFFCLEYFVYKITPLLDAIDRIAVDIPKAQEYIPADRTGNLRDKDSDLPTGKYGAKPVRSFSLDAKTNADMFDRTSTNYLIDSKIIPPQIQVFINFRGIQLRNNFVGHLVHALQKRDVNLFIDIYEKRGEDLTTLFKRIEDSGIAIVMFSTRYTESKWCLEELVKIKERVNQGLLQVIPIFYKVSPTDVKRLKGEFGDHFRDKEHMYGSDSPLIKAWKEAIVFVSHKFALTFDEKSCSGALEIDFVESIVEEVLEMLQSISTVESGQSSVNICGAG